VQRQMITVLACLCVLISASVAQAGPPEGPPVRPTHGAERRSAIEAILSKNGANSSAVGMDSPVITLKGACEPMGDIVPAKDCTSAITRAQFEKLASALQPEMPNEAKRTFATNYGRLLVFSDVARALHLENNPDVQQMVTFITNQALAEALRRHYAAEFANPSDQQIQDYYNQNSARYLEATLQRIIIPRNSGAADKPAPSDAENSATAEKLRQRWIAGEDPVKLQRSAFEAAGITAGSTPEIDLGSRRPGSLPADQESVFKLKAGEISQPFGDAAASYIYKVVAVREIPLSEVKDSIIRTLSQLHLQEKLEQLSKSVTPVLNDEYFGAPRAASPAGEVGGHPGQNAAPQSATPPR